MQLYIVRHGIAIDREDPKSPPDPDRFLTEEGIERTKQVAKGVVALGATADLLMSSPYVRAMQTAEIFAWSRRIGSAELCFIQGGSSDGISDRRTDSHPRLRTLGAGRKARG